MRGLAAGALVALSVSIMPAGAQAPPPPPPCAEDPGFHRLDFWLGEWRVLVGEQEVGTSSIEPILAGCAVRERWTAARGGRGESLFYYQPATEVWKQVWVTDGARGRGGVKEKTLVATLGDGSLRFQGEIPLAEGGSYLDRTTLSPLPEGRVRQLIEVSGDGRSWRTVFDAVYVPSGGRAAAGAAATNDAWLAALDVALARPELLGEVGAMAPAVSDGTIDQLLAGRR